MLESTPNGAYGAFYDEWCAATDEANAEDGVVRHFFPWWMEPAYRGPLVAADAMSAEERGLVVEAWPERGADRLPARAGADVRRCCARRSLPEDAETCFRTSGACCFDIDTLDQRMREAPEPVERRRNGALQVWLKPMPGREYVVAVDSAGGGEEGDFAAVQVVEIATGSAMCGASRAAAAGGSGARLAWSWRRSTVARRLLSSATITVRPCLRIMETRESYSALVQAAWRGWLADVGGIEAGDGRALGVLLSETPERFMSRRLLAECRTFVADERGRAAAAAGSHDDLVMAMAIAQAVRAEAIAWSGRASGARPVHAVQARA